MNDRRAIRFKGKKWIVRKRVKVGKKSYDILRDFSDHSQLAFDREGGPEGALRVIQTIDLSDERILPSLTRIANKNNPGVARIVHMDRNKNNRSRQCPDLRKLVLTYVHGSTLETLFERQERKEGEPLYRGRVAFELYRELARSLHHFQSAGLVHGDISPGNLVRIHNPSALRPIDFGEAWVQERTVKDTEPHHRRTTPGYGAPELYPQMRKLKPEVVLDGRVDMFSATVIFFQIITGKLPYGDFGGLITTLNEFSLDMEPETLSLHALRPEDFPKDIWKELDWIVRRGLALDPSNRFELSQEWLDALYDIKLKLDVQERKIPRGSQALSKVVGGLARFLGKLR